MMRQLATLAEAHAAHSAAVGLFTRVGVLVLVAVLLQAEALAAVATLDLFLRIVLFVVALQRELSWERSLASLDVALEDGNFLR